MIVALKTITTQTVQNESFAEEEITVVIAATVGPREYPDMDGWLLKGNYYKLEVVDNEDILTQIKPKRGLSKFWSDTTVDNTWDGMTFQTSGFTNNFKEMALKGLKNAIVSDGFLGLTANDLEEYVPSI